MFAIILSEHGSVYRTYIVEDKTVAKAILMKATDDILDDGQGPTYCKAYLDNTLSKEEVSDYRDTYASMFFDGSPDITIIEVFEHKVFTMSDVFDLLI